MFEKVKEFIGWFLATLAIFSLVMFLAIQSVLVFRLVESMDTSISPLKGKKVGLMKIEGPIMEIEDQLETLEEFRENDSVKAVLLDINSPGGAVSPSQELSKAVERVSDSGKPVIASIRSVGASGAYYIASSSDTIYANPGSMVGSIGVLIQFMKMKDLINKIGVEYRVVKSGRYKDLGSPFREMREDERKVLMNLIMDVYDQFIGHILDERNKFTRSRLESIADGRVFTGRQALKKGLIDRTGTRKKALKAAARAGGISGEPDIVRYSGDRFSIFRSMGELISPFTNLLRQRHRSFRLLYMMPQWGSNK
ncbi:MAG: signal peptide peptidase SppA [bacterium]